MEQHGLTMAAPSSLALVRSPPYVGDCEQRQPCLVSGVKSDQAQGTECNIFVSHILWSQVSFYATPYATSTQTFRCKLNLRPHTETDNQNTPHTITPDTNTQSTVHNSTA